MISLSTIITKLSNLFPFHINNCTDNTTIVDNYTYNMPKNFSAHATLNTWERIEYWGLYSSVYLLSLLPLRLLYSLSDLVFLLIYHVAGYRKDIVRKNLHNSFPEKSEEELQKIERGFYHFFCDLIFETVKGASISEKEMKRRMVFKGTEHLVEMLDSGKNVAVFLAHYCNWEWVTSLNLWLPKRDLYIGQIYHILESKVMDKLMLKLRSRWDTTNIPRNELLRRIVEQKKAGRQSVLGFISDQGPEMYTIDYWTVFLNQDTAIISGTETIARKYDFACLYLKISRPKRGYYVCEFQPMSFEPKQMPEFAVTEMYARMLERNIQEQPELWLWSHNRWKRTRQQWQQYLDYYNNRKKKVTK